MHILKIINLFILNILEMNLITKDRAMIQAGIFFFLHKPMKPNIDSLC